MSEFILASEVTIRSSVGCCKTKQTLSTNMVVSSQLCLCLCCRKKEQHSHAQKRKTNTDLFFKVLHRYQRRAPAPAASPVYVQIVCVDFTVTATQIIRVVAAQKQQIVGGDYQCSLFSVTFKSQSYIYSFMATAAKYKYKHAI